MSDDLIARLLKAAQDTGYGLFHEAADALEAAQAETERLREAWQGIESQLSTTVGDLAAERARADRWEAQAERAWRYFDEACNDCVRRSMDKFEAIARADAAEAAVAARDALLDEALELTRAAKHKPKFNGWCTRCGEWFPCRVDRWRRAVTELRGGRVGTDEEERSDG